MFVRVSAYQSVVLYITSACLLLACGSTPQKAEVAAAPKTVVEPKVPPRVEPSVTDTLLDSAEALFDEGRLLSPEEDNAYLRFRAIQILDPGNPRAQSGLDAILVNESSVIRDALSRSRLDEATQGYNRLKGLYPDAEVTKALAGEIAKLRESLRPVRVVESPVRALPEDRIYLDKTALSARSPEIVSQLQDIARGLVDSDESILIYARSDAEGRWIYQQMREGVNGYRIRGDIRIGDPAIRKLAPLE